MVEQKLTAEDVARLLRDPSGAVRADTARKLAMQYETPDLSESERGLAEDIFRLMLRDAEVRVRESLAMNLKGNPQVPHDVALVLVQDVDSVALPVIESSQVLTAEDLMEIVRGHDQDRQKAVARRDGLQDEVASSLIQEGSAEVAATLAANAGAQMTEKTILSMVDRFGDDPRVQDPLVHRAQLPVTVSERLVHRVSEALKDHLLKNHELPADVAADLVMQSRERAVITLSSESDEDEVERLVRQMDQHDRLTPSIILRSACMGDMKFFEYALAVRADVPVINTRQLIHDSGPLGLKGIVEKASLPAALYPALRAAVEVAHETDYDCGDNDMERYQRRMLERILTQYGDLGVDFEGNDLEYLLAKMNQMPALDMA
jgi:uncharacterized protein (DUF2336 family)